MILKNRIRFKNFNFILKYRLNSGYLFPGLYFKRYSSNQRNSTIPYFDGDVFTPMPDMRNARLQGKRVDERHRHERRTSYSEGDALFYLKEETADIYRKMLTDATPFQKVITGLKRKDVPDLDLGGLVEVLSNRSSAVELQHHLYLRRYVHRKLTSQILFREFTSKKSVCGLAVYFRIDFKMFCVCIRYKSDLLKLSLHLFVGSNGSTLFYEY